VDERCRAFWWSRRKARPWIEAQAKLQHFFPGKDVAYKKTARGRVAVMAGEYHSPEFVRFLDSLPRAERRIKAPFLIIERRRDHLPVWKRILLSLVPSWPRRHEPDEPL
jgi:hypothetical protein